MKSDKKVIIAGGRYFNDYELLKSSCDHLLKHVDQITIVSGKAKGADALGEKYADEKGYAKLFYPADWDKYGKSAGPKRNYQMAEVADFLIAFWDGESRGTKSMIDIAKSKGLQIRIIRYDNRRI